MRASIIIPSYNARERLYYNLVALNAQSYDKDDVEVIVIDNGSMDNTMEMLDSFKLKYPMKTVRVEENRGIAYGRNQGVKIAKGDILIFHDSDMIASRDFIKLHLEAHQEPDVVVCGLFWRRVFTYYYTRFSSEQYFQFNKIRALAGIPQAVALPDKFPLVTEEQVKNGALFPYSFDLDNGFIADLKAIVRQYGRNLDNYYLPWRFFITNNLSAERENVYKVGMFDNGIIKYGYEDYDLGIRLYKAGNKFVLADHIVSLHQEHPPNYNAKDLAENVNYMCDKYNNIYFIDMPLVCVSDFLGIGKTLLNGIMGDIRKILLLNEYHIMLELFLELLQIIRKRYFSPKEDYSGDLLSRIADNMKEYVHKANELKTLHGITFFLNQLNQFFKIVFNLDFNSLMKANAQQDKGEL